MPFHVHDVGDFNSVADIVGSVPPIDPAHPRGSEQLLRRLIGLADEFPDLRRSTWNGSPVVGSDPVFCADEKLLALLYPLSPKMTRRVLRRAREEIRREQAGVSLDQRDIRKTVEQMQLLEDHLIDLTEWTKKPFVLQSAPVTRLHQLQEAVASGDVFDVTRMEGRMTPADISDWGEMIAGSTVFVVEHDWASAFEGAEAFAEGEVRLPADICAFELRISGRHVIAFAAEADGVQHMQFASLSPLSRWLVLPRAGNEHDEITQSLAVIARAQIKAIAVALDAEVAETSVVRASYKLNRARAARGHLPVFDYHVVSLARRSRVPRLPSDRADDEPRSRRRLHFRRGHWRHYDNHKTWIKWMLVGSPDLGFVDKHYRL